MEIVACPQGVRYAGIYYARRHIFLYNHIEKLHASPSLSAVKAASEAFYLVRRHSYEGTYDHCSRGKTGRRQKKPCKPTATAA